MFLLDNLKKQEKQKQKQKCKFTNMIKFFKEKIDS